MFPYIKESFRQEHVGRQYSISNIHNLLSLKREQSITVGWLGSTCLVCLVVQVTQEIFEKYYNGSQWFRL